MFKDFDRRLNRDIKKRVDNRMKVSMARLEAMGLTPTAKDVDVNVSATVGLAVADTMLPPPDSACVTSPPSLPLSPLRSHLSFFPAKPDNPPPSSAICT